MTPAIYDNVDTAISQVAHFTDGRTLSRNAAEMGVSVDWLSRAVNPDEKPRCPAALIVPLTQTTQNFAIVRTICRLVGMVAIQIPKPGCKPADVIGGITEVTREYSESMAALTPCLDGATTSERAAAVRQLSDLIERASALRAHLEPTK